MALVVTGDVLADTKPEAEELSAKELAVEWIVEAMSIQAPPGRKLWYPDAQETVEEGRERYYEIANHIVEVVYDPSFPALFKGPYGRSRTVTVILGIMLHESGFMKNVDYGLGKYGRGDKGKSWCLMQMKVKDGRAWENFGGWNQQENRPRFYGDEDSEIVQGASGPEMVEDRRNCIREGLRLVMWSFRSCKKNPPGERLNAYASGNCQEGADGSRRRLRTAQVMWYQTAASRKKFKDKDVSQQVLAMLERRARDEALAEKASEKDTEEARVAKVEDPEG